MPVAAILLLSLDGQSAPRIYEDGMIGYCVLVLSSVPHRSAAQLQETLKDVHLWLAFSVLELSWLHSSTNAPQLDGPGNGCAGPVVLCSSSEACGCASCC